eukprot:CAMPEP_0170549998 /NCGR_PEP_ID=MMETSP0211-20121228/8056_1 /TAXON_ID=311385 /ORGANISM="Pseudokeronopsis sp., Strain OXSARD2" /LENGTH=91 /DNA_ID=CAMNT_0010856261 /DNA_START=1896 /DNA_END=2171 /DNA_ORIENTATION=+
MTHYKALSSIDNHYKNNSNLNFQKIREQETLMTYMKQIPNKIKKVAEEEDLSSLYYEDGKKFEEQSSSLRYSQTVIERQRKRIGFEALMYI